MITSKTVLAITIALLVGCGPPQQSGTQGASSRQQRYADVLQRTPASSNARNTLARAPALRATGQHQQAISELEAAISAARERVDFDAMAALWRERGGLHLELAEPEKALAAFGKRLEIARSLKQTRVRASALADTALAFVRLGRLGQGDDAAAQAKLLGGESLRSDALAQERLGLIATALANDELAIKHFTIARAAYGADAASVARVDVHRARRAGSGAAVAQQLTAIEGSVGSVADLGPHARLALARATLELQNGNMTSCLAAAQRTLSLSRPRGLRRVTKHAHIVAARCAEGSKKLAVAIENADAAAAMIEDELGAVRASLARQELGFQAFLTYRLLVELEIRSRGSKRAVKRAFRLSEQARGRSHLDAVVRSEIAPFSATLETPPGLARDRAIAEERVRRLTAALRENRERKNANRHRDALWALEEINEAIAGQNPLLARVATPRPATVARVRRRLLDDESVLVSYFLTSDKLFVFAITKDGQKLATIDGSLDDIDRSVRSYRNDYLLDRDADIDDMKEAGAALYARLIGPVEALVKGKKRLLVVPHGTLSTLPFEALVTPRERFVVQDQLVHYAVSASMAVAMAEKKWRPAKVGASFIGIGDPIYEWPTKDADRGEHTQRLAQWRSAAGETRSASLNLKRIPGTGRELKEIAKLFGKRAQIHLRGHASEELAKSGKLADHTIVHIASHGLMAPHYQALALSLDPESGEDGFLMSSEIAQLQLSAELVVLSACGTGNTASRSSEPVAGMALSLRSAGARSVMLSLWNVSDLATADLMVAFYGAVVSDKTSYIESLARAKRGMLRGKYAHPFYWAAFTLHGS